MDQQHSPSQQSSLPYGRSTVDPTTILISHKDKDRLCHPNLSSGDVTVEEYSMSTSEFSEGSTNVRRSSVGHAQNIPYMQLFHHLKQRFPDLKDCDINESIQRYGLDRVRCEADLQQRAQSYLCGYYGPWGRVGNWSNRSSPTTTPTRNASLTSPNTPTLSPHLSPFSSQSAPHTSVTMASSRSTPKLFSPEITSNYPGPREANTIPSCSSPSSVPASQLMPSTMAYSSSLTPSLATTAGPAVYTPTSLFNVSNNSINNNIIHDNQSIFTTSSIRNGSGIARATSTESDPYHTTTTRHYVGTSVCRNANDPFFRQYSNSSETITEESSLVGSNLPSPAPTLTFSSPQSPFVSPPIHNHCTEIPDLSRRLQELPIAQTSIQHQFHQPINPFLPTWNQGNNQTSDVSELPNTSAFAFANDVMSKQTQEHNSQTGRLYGSANRDNSGAHNFLGRWPEPNNSSDKLALNSLEVQRRRPNPHTRLEPVRIAPPPPAATSSGHQISSQADLQLRAVPSPSSLAPSSAPPPLQPSAAAGLHQPPTAKVDNRKGLLEDQRARQQRMLSVLMEGTKDRSNLQEEVSKLTHTLEECRQRGVANANQSAKLILNIQEENRLLQSECDEMEGLILQTGEDPDLMETYGGHYGSGEGPGYSLSSPSSPLPARTQPNNRGVSVGRGAEGPQRFTPTRVAPPPPVCRAYIATSTAPQFPSSDYDSLHHQPPVSGNGSETTRWSCNRCTYDNHPDMTSCEICGALRMSPSPRTPAGGLQHSSLVPELSSRADPL